MNEQASKELYNGVVIELANCTNTLLREIFWKECTRNDVAATYSYALASTERTDWQAVNDAILARWSKSALLYIKKRAWKLLEDRHERP